MDYSSAALLAVGVVLGAVVVRQSSLGHEPSRAPGPATVEPTETASAKHDSSFQQPQPRPTPTRGPAPSYHQVGILTKRGEDPDATKAPTILPLYGRPSYRGAAHWFYYCSSDKFNVVKLPVVLVGGKKECSKEPGCQELQDGDVVSVPAYRSDFDVTRYNPGADNIYDPDVF